MKVNPHFCSPKLYFLPNMQMSKNTPIRLLRTRSPGPSFQAHARPQKNGKFLFADCEKLATQPALAWLLVGRLVGLTGLEPVTLRLSSACSNQLSYRPDYVKASSGKPAGVARPTVLSAVALAEAEALVAERRLEVRGLEPLTYSLQSYRSTD